MFYSLEPSIRTFLWNKIISRNLTNSGSNHNNEFRNLIWIMKRYIKAEHFSEYFEYYRHLWSSLLYKRAVKYIFPVMLVY